MGHYDDCYEAEAAEAFKERKSYNQTMAERLRDLQIVLEDIDRDLLQNNSEKLRDAIDTFNDSIDLWALRNDV